MSQSSFYKHSNMPGSTEQADLGAPEATSSKCLFILDALMGFKGQLYFENRLT